MYLKTAFGENFNKSIIRCGGLLQRLTQATLSDEDQLPRGDGQPGNDQARGKQLPKKESGLFKSIFDKVDEFASSRIVSDLQGKPRHSSRSFAELEAAYLEHADLFKRIGLVFGNHDDFEMQLATRDTQIAALWSRIDTGSKHVISLLKEKGLDIASLDLAVEDVQSLVALVMFSSLHYQETKVGLLLPGTQGASRCPCKDLCRANQGQRSS